MPKGKKFDAAQKHFQEKEQRLNRMMRAYEHQANEATAKAEALQSENEQLRMENAKLTMINQQLQELHNLSDADIKALLDRAHSLNTLTSLMDILPHYMT